MSAHELTLIEVCKEIGATPITVLEKVKVYMERLRTAEAKLADIHRTVLENQDLDAARAYGVDDKETEMLHAAAIVTLHPEDECGVCSGLTDLILEALK